MKILPSSLTREARIQAALGLLALMGLFGCRANMAPVLNINDAPVGGMQADWNAPGGAARSPLAVRAAIMQALALKAWTIDGEQAGLIVATVSTPPHFGQIGITYTGSSYSIAYRNSSPGLKYDGQIIHRRYNNWVNQLRQTIDKQLTLQPAGAAGVVAAPGAPVPPGVARPAPNAWTTPPASAAPAAPAPTPVPAVPPRGPAAAPPGQPTPPPPYAPPPRAPQAAPPPGGYPPGYPPPAYPPAGQPPPRTP